MGLTELPAAAAAGTTDAAATEHQAVAVAAADTKNRAAMAERTAVAAEVGPRTAEVGPAKVTEVTEAISLVVVAVGLVVFLIYRSQDLAASLVAAEVRQQVGTQVAEDLAVGTEARRLILVATAATPWAVPSLSVVVGL